MSQDEPAAAGPETDRLVAERFMGWHLESPWRGSPATPKDATHWHDRRGVATGWATEPCCGSTMGAGVCDVFAPSTEPRHALDVVLGEAVRRGLVFRVMGPGNPARAETACDLISGAGVPLASGRAETIALAVCRAALGL